MIAAPDRNGADAVRSYATNAAPIRAAAAQAGSAAGPLEAESRRVRGRALRRTVSRGSHAAWKPVTERSDPIALLEAQARFLLPEDVRVRYERMLQSPLAFLQGAAIVMVADLSSTPATGIQVQLCGDAHLANFAIFATPERPSLFDIVDFDETLPGPWEWDVKRLAASLVLAARENGVNADKRRAIVLSALSGYRRRMRTLATLRESDLWYWQLPDEDILAFLSTCQRPRRKHRRPRTSRSRSRPPLGNLAGLVQVVDGRCRFNAGSTLVSHVGTEAIKRTVRGLLRTYRRTLEGHQQRFLEGFELVDSALRVQGIGGLGTRHFLALLQRPDSESLLLQVTEARASLLSRHLPNSVYRNQGQRVAAGQRLIGAADDLLLGWVRDDNGRDYHVRQAQIPTVAIDVRSLSARTIERYAALCGAALARAHARSGDRIQIAAYLGKRDRFDRAIAGFAESYADQIERDHQALVRAVRSGRITTAGVSGAEPPSGGGWGTARVPQLK